MTQATHKINKGVKNISYMEIRKAKDSEIKEIKKIVDKFEEMDVIKDTFPETYYRRILKKGILLVAIENNELAGVCFGTYNTKEKWADLLGLVVKEKIRKKGIGSSLVQEFEKIVKSKKLKTIDLYADKTQLRLFKNLSYKQGRTYIAFRKKF
jgi:N-acetylglutamate synthase-like GNAT family acetyltransferase